MVLSSHYKKKIKIAKIMKAFENGKKIKWILTPLEQFDYENGNYPGKAHLQCLSVLDVTQTLLTEVCAENSWQQVLWDSSCLSWWNQLQQLCGGISWWAWFACLWCHWGWSFLTMLIILSCTCWPSTHLIWEKYLFISSAYFLTRVCCVFCCWVIWILYIF